MNALESAEILLRVLVRRQKCAELLTPMPIPRHGTVLIGALEKELPRNPLQLLPYQCWSKIRLSIRLRPGK
jgi:hypothetical protein